jgi:hypothetical protein
MEKGRPPWRMRIVGVLREKRGKTRAVWIDERVRVERSPPSPSESQFAPTTRIMRSAVEARLTACYEEKIANEVKRERGKGTYLLDRILPIHEIPKKLHPSLSTSITKKIQRSKLNSNWCVGLKNTLNVSEYVQNDYPSMSS